MEIYIFLMIAIGVFSLVSVLYIRNNVLKDHDSILVVSTCNCAVICEGVLREVVNTMKRMGRGELVVLDKRSVDGTYEILKRLALKYAFSVVQVNNEQEAREIVELYSREKNYKLLVMDKYTQYSTVRAQIVAVGQNNR